MAVLHGYCEENEKERSARERKKEGGVAWRAGILQGVFSSSRRQAGRGSPAALRRTRTYAAYWKKKKGIFAENPLGFGRFQGKNRNCTLCNIW
jgi:hypothetical protein